MASFAGLLEASDEALLKLAYHTGQSMGAEPKDSARLAAASSLLGLSAVQLACALGFRARPESLSEVAALLGLSGVAALLTLRDRGFVEDSYERLPMRDLLTLYELAGAQVADRAPLLALLPDRLRRVEERIEATVNPLTIERYKKEVRAFYGAGLASADFALGRLADMASGFRGLTDEAALIAEHGVMAVETLFNLATLLPSERKRLFRRGLFARALLEERLQRPDVLPPERAILEAALRRA